MIRVITVTSFIKTFLLVCCGTWLPGFGKLITSLRRVSEDGGGSPSFGEPAAYRIKRQKVKNGSLKFW
jgi:hypothetical protein